MEGLSYKILCVILSEIKELSYFDGSNQVKVNLKDLIKKLPEEFNFVESPKITNKLINETSLKLLVTIKKLIEETS